LFNQLLKFGATGLLNTVIDLVIFNLLVAVTGFQTGWPLGLINILAISTAATNSYLMNCTWTFQARTHKHQGQITKFIAATSIGMLLNSVVIMAASTMAPLFPFSIFFVLNAGKIAGAILSATWNFLSYRYWVFASPAREALSVQESNVPVAGMLSLVIPAYNESKRLENRIKSLASHLAACDYPVEIIIVNDGSQDNTLAIGRQLSRDFPFVTCLNHKTNQGKGAAVRSGVLSARGEFIIFTDADDTFSFFHISQIFASLKKGHDIAIGNREGKKQRLEGESWLRKVMGKTFNLYVQALLLPGCTDSQCGLKGFRREAAREIFRRQRLRRFAFDVEILSLARALKYDIAVVGISAADCAGSTVHPLLAPIQMAIDILRVKIGMTFNFYGLKDLTHFRLETSTLLVLFIAAMAFRLPWLWQVPRYVDELREVNLALDIYLGKVLPLHNVASDIGAMHNYILAGLFKLFGPSIYLPRLYVAVTSALTVILVYRLGCRLFNRNVGLVAAALILTNGMHILVTHMAWSNCTTPLFFVLAVLATINARDKCSGGWLAASALLWAAVLQTHSSSIIYVVVAAVYIVSPYFRNLTGIKTNWYIASMVVFLGAYANMIYYNIISWGGSLAWAAQKSYAIEAQPGIMSYLNNLAQMSVELLRTISCTYSFHPRLIEYASHPLFLLAIFLLALGVREALKQKEYFLIMFLGAGFAILPWVNTRYTFYLATRYIMPQVICAILLVSLALVTLYHKYRSMAANPRMVTKAAITLLAAAVFLQPLPYFEYCRQAGGTNISNKIPLKVMTIIQSTAKEDTIVLLDRNLPLINQPLPVLLALSGQRFVTFSANSMQNQLERNANKKVIAILSQSSYEHLQVPAREIHSLSQKIVIPHTVAQPETIYVLKMEGMNQPGYGNTPSLPAANARQATAR
jgi:glycosyltransferase involved in cell wall biosynthesis/putative flippase GtrA